MKRISLIAVFTVATMIGLFVLGNRNQVGPQVAPVESLTVADKMVTVYKSPTCGCCAQYITYLQSLGFTVTVKDTDMKAIKAQYQIPQDLESCHTTIAGDYFIEGHVPIEAVTELLASKPALRGIGLPAMPSGTPGMPGAKTQVWQIQQVDAAGNISNFMSI